MGKGLMPSDSEFALFTIGLQTRDYVASGFDQADLVIAVGYDFVEYAPSNWNPHNDKRILHIDMTIAETDAAYVPNVEVVGDIGGALTKILELAKPKPENFASKLRELILKEMERCAHDDSMPVKPQRFMHDLRSVLDGDDIVVSDVGAHKLWVAHLFPAHVPNSVIISNGLSAMGIGLPGAIAAKLVHPTRNVVTICGDGGFMMNCQELETAKRLGLNVVIVIFRDDGYGSIRWKQLDRYGQAFGVDFGNPDYAAFAKSFGVEGYRIENPRDIIPTLETAFNAGGPAVIDVLIDYRENLILSKELGGPISRM